MEIVSLIFAIFYSNDTVCYPKDKDGGEGSCSAGPGKDTDSQSSGGHVLSHGLL